MQTVFPKKCIPTYLREKKMFYILNFANFLKIDSILM